MFSRSGEGGGRAGIMPQAVVYFRRCFLFFNLGLQNRQQFVFFFGF